MTTSLQKLLTAVGTAVTIVFGTLAMPPTPSVIYIAPTTLAVVQNESYTPKMIDGLIRHYSSELGADLTLALNIAWCESHMDYDAKNPTSSAKGIYQFVDSTFNKYCEGDPLNPKDNIKCGVKLQAQKLYGHWSESVNCWKYLPYNF